MKKRLFQFATLALLSLFITGGLSAQAQEGQDKPTKAQIEKSKLDYRTISDKCLNCPSFKKCYGFTDKQVDSIKALKAKDGLKKEVLPPKEVRSKEEKSDNKLKLGT